MKKWLIMSNKVAHSGWLSGEWYYCLCFIPPVLDNICIMSPMWCWCQQNDAEFWWNEDSFNSPLLLIQLAMADPTGRPKGVIFISTLVETPAWNCSLLLQLQSSQEQWNTTYVHNTLHTLYITHCHLTLNSDMSSEWERGMMAAMTVLCTEMTVLAAPWKWYFSESVNAQLNVSCLKMAAVFHQKPSNTMMLRPHIRPRHQWWWVL